MAKSGFGTYQEYLDEGLSREEAVQRLGAQLGLSHHENMVELGERMQRIEEEREGTPTGTGQSSSTMEPA